MLEVVAHEDDVELSVRKQVGELETVPLHEVDIGGQIGRDVSKIGRPLFAGADVADEVASVARDVEHRRGGVDIALQMAGDLLPYRVFALRLFLAETQRVDLLEVEVVAEPHRSCSFGFAALTYAGRRRPLWPALAIR